MRAGVCRRALHVRFKDQDFCAGQGSGGDLSYACRRDVYVIAFLEPLQGRYGADVREGLDEVNGRWPMACPMASTGRPALNMAMTLGRRHQRFARVSQADRAHRARDRVAIAALTIWLGTSATKRH